MPAAIGWATSCVVSYQGASRSKDNWNAVFGVFNGMFLSAVLAHFIYWPKRWFLGVPSLTECEGLVGRILMPYNIILYLSGLAAVSGLAENGRGGRCGVLVPVVFVPMLLRIQPDEFRRLKVQARQHPGWWNRRLQTG